VLIWEFRFEHSTIIQKASLTAGSRRLDFHTEADWHETHRMLRVDFPLAIPFDDVRCEQGFGFIRRPARRNTIAERHCFEFSVQRCMIAGDGTHRAALMSDSKYGGKAYDNSFGLNLLRSPRYPDEVTDRGHQEFCYSFMLCDGRRGDAEAREAALELNRPPLCFPELSGTIAAPVASVAVPGVSVEALKRAEDDGGILVLRLVEQYGNHVSGTVELHAPRRVAESDLQETPRTEWSAPMRSIPLAFAPFEIKTLLLKL